MTAPLGVRLSKQQKGVGVEKYLSPDQVCDLIPGMTRQLLAAMRWRGDGPSFVKPSPRKIVYSISSIEEYMRSKERTRTDQGAA